MLTITATICDNAKMYARDRKTKKFCRQLSNAKLSVNKGIEALRDTPNGKGNILARNGKRIVDRVARQTMMAYKLDLLVTKYSK